MLRDTESRKNTHLQVQLTVHVLVNLLGVTVATEKTTKDTLPTNPQSLGGHTGLGGTLALTGSAVATFQLGRLDAAPAGTGMHVHGLLDDETILDQLADVGTCVEEGGEGGVEVSAVNA